MARNRLHLRNVRRVATTKHPPHRPMCAGHCAPEIVHQFLDPAAAGQPLAEKGFFKHSRNLTTGDTESTESILGILDSFSLCLERSVVN